MRILNQSPPASFRESVKIAEQNLYARSRELVGDRNPREHEFAVQIRSFDEVINARHPGLFPPADGGWQTWHITFVRLAGEHSKCGVVAEASKVVVFSPYIDKYAFVASKTTGEP